MGKKKYHNKSIYTTIDKYEYSNDEKTNYRNWYWYINSIKKVGNILNQIARRSHYQGYIEDEKFLRKMENDLGNLILNIKKKYLLPEKK